MLVGGVVDLAVGFGRAFGFTCAAVVVLLTADELVGGTFAMATLLLEGKRTFPV